MWEDRGTHWAWIGGRQGYTDPPTIKEVHYATIHLSGGSPKRPYTMNLAVAVSENGITRKLFQEQLEWFKNRGCKIDLPKGYLHAV